MDRFTLEILSRTIDFSIEAMPPDENPLLVDCVVTIRDYIEFSGEVSLWKLRAAIVELPRIARMNGQSLIVAHLTPIAKQLDAELDRDVA